MRRPEDSEQLRFAYSVADRVVSGKHTSPGEDQALPAKGSPVAPHETVDPAASPANEARHQMEEPKEELDITSARPERTHADV